MALLEYDLTSKTVLPIRPCQVVLTKIKNLTKDVNNQSVELSEKHELEISNASSHTATKKLSQSPESETIPFNRDAEEFKIAVPQLVNDPPKVPNDERVETTELDNIINRVKNKEHLPQLTVEECMEYLEGTTVAFNHSVNNDIIGKTTTTIDKVFNNDAELAAEDEVRATKLCNVVIEKLQKIPKIVTNECKETLDRTEVKDKAPGSCTMDINHNNVVDDNVKRSARNRNNHLPEHLKSSKTTLTDGMHRELREKKNQNYNVSDIEQSLNESMLEYSNIGEDDVNSDSNLDLSFCTICKGYDDPDLDNQETETEKQTEWLGCDCDRWYHKSCISHVASHIGLSLEIETFNCEQVNQECIQ